MKLIRECDEVEERDETIDILRQVRIARRYSRLPLRSKVEKTTLARRGNELSLKHKVKKVNHARSDHDFQMENEVKQ